jgi:hypothetical protein
VNAVRVAVSGRVGSTSGEFENLIGRNLEPIGDVAYWTCSLRVYHYKCGALTFD